MSAKKLEQPPGETLSTDAPPQEPARRTGSFSSGLQLTTDHDLCPGCGELRATVNPRNNLAHCFCCDRNFNNIDLLITLGHDFLSAVERLEQWLRRHQEHHNSSTS